MNSAKVTRDELFRQVWETPMVRLAAEYGISGNGLAKICDRLNIPYPPRGYWAKKAAGQKAIRYRLPEPGKDTPLEVTISATMPKPKPPVPGPDLVAQIEAIKQEIASPPANARAGKPHPVIAGWLEEHARRLKEYRRERNPFWSAPEPFSEADLRRHNLLDTLFKALERQGGKVTQVERGELQCMIDGEPVTFQMREKFKQTRRPLTDSEKRWKSTGDNDWKTALQPTGRFVFAIKTYLPSGLRHEWLETSQTTMEDLLPELVSVILAAGPLLVEQRRQREETERLRRIAEHERYLENERRKRDRNRWRRFVELAHQSRDAEIARTFLNSLRAQDIDPVKMVDDRKLEDWVAWAEGWILEDDPLNHRADSVFQDVGKVTSWTYRD